MKLPEPQAYRFDFDGYGYDYRDNGTGSSWKDGAARNHGEFLYTADQMREMYCRGIEDAQARLLDMHDKTMNRNNYYKHAAIEIGKLKEKAND